MHTATLQATKDTHVMPASPETNYGDAEGLILFASHYAQGSWPLIGFDSSSLPSGVTFSSLKLRLYVTNQSPFPGVVNVYGITETWGELTAKWSNRPSAGATMLGTRSGYWSDETWYEITLDLADKTALDALYGFELEIPTNDQLAGISLSSREGTHPPELVVTYYDPTHPEVTGAMELPALEISGKALAQDDPLVVCYQARYRSTLLPATGDVANHTLRVVTDGIASAPFCAPRELDATNAPGIYTLRLTAAEAAGRYVSLVGKSSTEDVELLPVLNVAGVHSVAIQSGQVVLVSPSQVVLANVYQVDSVRNAAIHLQQDIEDGFDRGLVVDESDPYDYEDCTPGTLTFCTDLPQRGTNGYRWHVVRLETGTNPAFWRRILSSEDVGTAYTRLTLKHALPIAPAVGDRVTVGGCLEPEA